MKIFKINGHGQRMDANPTLNRLDKLGVFASATCLIHCWSFPILLVFFPGMLHAHEWGHPLFGGLALISFTTFLVKRKTKLTDKLFFVAASVGIILISSAIFMHQHLSQFADITLNTTGGILLLCAHGRNWLRH